MNSRLEETNALNEFFEFLDKAEFKALQDNIAIESNQTDDLQMNVENQINELENELDGQQQKENEVAQQLEEVKAQALKEISDLKAKMKSKLATQKSKFEMTAQKHRNLLKDLKKKKEDLKKQCEEFEKQKELAQIESNKRERRMMTQANLEFAQQKELAIANERERQKQILEQKTKEIKEKIVAELEPKLQKLIEEQKNEIATIQEKQKKSLEEYEKQSDQQVENEKNRQIEQLEAERQSEFEQLQQNLQRKLEKERDLQKAELERLQLKLKSTEMDKNESITSAKEEGEALIQEHYDKWKAQLIDERIRASQEIKNIDAKIQRMEEEARKEAQRIAKIREAKVLEEMETETKQKNEKKLQLVVKKLEEETNSMRKKKLEEAEQRIVETQKENISKLNNLKEIKDQQQKEVDELRTQVENEKILCTKIDTENNELLNQIQILRDRRDELINNISKAKNSLEVAQENKIKRDKENLIQQTTKRENLRAQLNEAKVTFEKQKQIWAQEREQKDQQNRHELNSISKKVKGSIEEKEQVIYSLKSQIATAENRLHEIESLFHQQKRIAQSGKKM